MSVLVDDDLTDILEKVEAGERLAYEDGVRLYRSRDVLGIGYMANIVRQRRNGNDAYYIVNRHINYTNICSNACKFCAFSRREDEQGAYTMTLEEILDRAAEGAETGATEFHLVGGAHPTLPLKYYLEMIGALHANHPRVHIQAFTAVEIANLAEVAGLPVSETLKQLAEAGLGSMPGGGAEVFANRVRQEVCPTKLPGDDWLTVMREAHRLGIRSNATMLYGHMEQPEERVQHLIKLRELQDETGGFMSFIPLAFHPANTEMSDLSGPTGLLDLKTLSIGRLMLDNFDHVKAFWIMLGTKLAQISLSFGVDDMNGTVLEERITHAAGAETPQSLTVREITALIEEAGRRPVERNTVYQRIRREKIDDARWSIDEDPSR